jgi:hypothetical protein
MVDHEQAMPPWLEANFAQYVGKTNADKCFAAFGRFIAAYALAEAGFHVAARHFSGVSDDKARIIFSGMRLLDLVGRLRDLVIGTSAAPLIDELKTQIDIIGTERDQFVHRIVAVQRGGLKVTNHLTAKSVSSVKPKIFSLSELEAMTRDCLAIFARLRVLSDHSGDLRLHGPWRYIRPSQGRPKNHKIRNHGVPKESPRQRRSSRASRSDQPEKA